MFIPLTCLLLIVSPYDPDSQFSMSALCRLENKGIPVLKSLEPLHKELAVVAKVALSGGANSEYMHSDPRNATEIIIRQWTLGEKPILPPTWRSLYQVLRELGLEDLSQEIEEFLSSELPTYTANNSVFIPLNIHNPCRYQVSEGDVHVSDHVSVAAAEVS